MSEFSSDPATVLGRLHPKQIDTLVEILRHGNLRQTSFVESIFNERARHFSETLQFLKDIGWVSQHGDELELSGGDALIAAGGQSGSQTIADAISRVTGPYQQILAAYLQNFRFHGGRMLHFPSPQARLEQSAIRNVLMELGLVSHHLADDSYELHEGSAHLYLWARNIHGAASKAELESQANQRDELGIAAEAAVLAFEKEQVGPSWATHIEHVSAKNPGACFDIKSLRIRDGLPIYRYIEVKAVPVESFQFYWTAAELEAASLLRQTYFLYLIPAVGGRDFDIRRMSIIEDPFHSIYENPNDWEKNDKIIVCRRKLNTKNSQ
jgi:hypothetical protein